LRRIITMNASGWNTLIRDFVEYANQGDHSLLQSLCRTMEENDAAREMINAKGYGIGSNSLLEAVKEIPVKPKANILDRELNTVFRNKRILNMIKSLGIRTIGELVQKTGLELRCVRDFGVSSLHVVREELQRLGLKLKGD
jgi:DNA-directed RNA polymerase alpha subunit